MLTWAVAGVACWLLGNVAFVLGMVRCRDRARRAAGGHAARGDAGRVRAESAGGRGPLRLVVPGRRGH